MKIDEEFERIPERSWSGWRKLLGYSLIIFSFLWFMIGLYIMYHLDVCCLSGLALLFLGVIALMIKPDGEYD